jgi:hypothetical protein
MPNRCGAAPKNVISNILFYFFSRSLSSFSQKKKMLVYANNWHIVQGTKIVCFGLNTEDEPVAITIEGYRASFLVQFRDGDLPPIKKIISWIARKCSMPVDRAWHNFADRMHMVDTPLLKSAWGYTGDEKYRYVQFATSHLDMYTSVINQLASYEARIERDAAALPSAKYEIHNFHPPLLQMAHDAKIDLHGWIKINGVKEMKREATTAPYQLSSAQAAMREQAPHPCLFFWDIETYSADPETRPARRRHLHDRRPHCAARGGPEGGDASHLLPPDASTRRGRRGRRRASPQLRERTRAPGGVHGTVERSAAGVQLWV